jgi:hypothetical protein
MTNKAGRSKRNKRVLVSAVVIFLVAISILAYIGALNQTVKPTPTVQLAESSKYFAISDLAGTCTASGSNKSAPVSVLVNFFAFNFTPVGGDANDVRIFTEGMSDPLEHDWEGLLIRNGTSTYSGDFQLKFQIPCYRQSDGTYTLTVTILAREAEGDVTLNFTLGENLFAI